MKKSHDTLRAACKDMVCAIRENPSAFDGIQFPSSVRTIANDHKQASTYSVGALGIVIAAFMRFFH